MANKKTSRLTKLNFFANSPASVKLFGGLVAALMVVSVGYGGYTLISQQFSSASAKYGPWYPSSPGVTHNIGSKVNPKYIPTIFNGLGAEGPVWYAKTSSWISGGGIVWDGPYKKLPTGRQYLGCFFYQANADGSSNGNGVTSLYVRNATTGRIFNSYPANGRVQDDPLHLAGKTVSKGKLGRTCMAFFVPGGADKNRIGLRARLFDGSVMIRKTKISEVPNKKRKLPDLYSLKRHDNETILHGFRYGR